MFDLYPRECLRQAWSGSKVFRRVLIIVLIYTLLRLVVHGVFLADILISGQTEGYDLQIYLDAAERLRLGADLYPKGELDRIEFYQYAPAYALAFIPFRGIPVAAVMIIHSLLHLVAYFLLYVSWDRIFRRRGLDRAREMLAWTLPLWLVFSQFWSDLGYLNVYIFMAFLSTLLIDAILDERLGRSLLWLSIILQIKPQWAFAAAIPLLLGRRRFFIKLLALTVLVYAAVVGVTMLVVGPAYGWQQYVDYFRLLWNIQGGNYPWRGPDAEFPGYNHSITQTVVYLLGVKPSALRIATLIKVVLLLPLGVVILRYLRRSPGCAGRDVPRLGLNLVFALYLGAFIALSVVWELTLSVAVFTYLLATLDQRNGKRLAWAVFAPYALLDFWQLLSFIVLGPNVIVPGPFVLTDPSIYIPTTMIVILTFYALLVRELWFVPVRPVEGARE